MITPYQIEELFEPNFNEPEHYDNYIIIDDYFKNYDRIYEMTSNLHVSNGLDGRYRRNFTDYYDCRSSVLEFNPDVVKRDKRKKYLESIMKNQWEDMSGITLSDSCYTGNLFKFIKPHPNNYQHRIHQDYQFYNVVVYIDKESSGGTALYSTREKGKEFYSLMSPLEEDNLPIDIIQAKPNRCAIFHGKTPHGAWIEDNKVYEKNWRMNYVSLISGIKN